jgi:hypothetical protein
MKLLSFGAISFDNFCLLNFLTKLVNLTGYRANLGQMEKILIYNQEVPCKI